MMAIITVVDEDGQIIVKDRAFPPEKEWINEKSNTKTAIFRFEITRVLLPNKILMEDYIK